MYELPEAAVVSNQINTSLRDKVVTGVEVNHSPHKFAFFNKPLEEYEKSLMNKKVMGGDAYSSRIVVRFEDIDFLVWDGARLTYHNEFPPLASKHQLKLGFAVGESLLVSVQMYGGIELWKNGDPENFYYSVAKAKPNPLSKQFTEAYFDSLFTDDSLNLSMKAFLATNQRIPGLGNGVLQDILFGAGIHPKRKVGTIKSQDRGAIYRAITGVLKEMETQGGRDTETDLFGISGGYRTLASRYKDNEHCPRCGAPIVKESYLGGAIYYCASCQT